MENKDSTSTINIDEWARELENKSSYEAQRHVRYQNSTIFKVSKNLRSVQPEAYEPMIVSLGPYHCHQPHLQDTNQLKRLLINKLLEKGYEKSLRNYLTLVKEEETKARNTYSEQPIDMCEKEFIEMMLLDCVFVIMILWFWKKDESGLKEIEIPSFLNRQGSWRIVARDMLLLENQLPFFLLEALFGSAFPNMRGSLKEWVVQFFSGFVINDKVPEVPKDTKTIHHILHLFYLCIVPSDRSSNVVFARSTVLKGPRMGRVQTATQLEATGIELKRKQKAMSFLDITFNEGVLEIPQIRIDDDTDILFRNLIALEQCQKSTNCYDISTYAWVLSCITCTVNDVDRLQQKEIIINGFSNTNEVVNLFNNDKRWNRHPNGSLAPASQYSRENKSRLILGRIGDWGSKEFLAQQTRILFPSATGDLRPHDFQAPNQLIVNLFNKLCKEVVVDHKNCYISNVFKEVEKYRSMKELAKYRLMENVNSQLQTSPIHADARLEMMLNQAQEYDRNDQHQAINANIQFVGNWQYLYK
ncbi:UPF0481 protein At3g47200-like [Zingiber officinale]|uniref:UPF0481 protein At3g47200-like n=1 Tax=Zingiber officinale TaxID=94328 RepID=UPI001C4AAE8D|nr:UPF0481 protein At3g47200-like [Zingiber officinale]XP_042426549.1 UPF0481 protein At3g47200-like [Zingiber officinale]XP_042426550.1 UPF0481 protein At3g47200-like [Zingiber officinale]XP_042426551.1 UPF0481 protein At3g47200-like [Zingiber officinale]